MEPAGQNARGFFFAACLRATDCLEVGEMLLKRTVILVWAALAATVPARSDILIGAVGPMKGQYAAFGEQIRRGAQKAVDDINAAGGVNGQRLALVVDDDGCDPKQAVTAAQRLVAQGVKFVDGHYCSGSSIAATKTYADAGIVMISPASTHPRFTDEGSWNANRICPRDDAQGAFAGRAVARAFAGKNMAIIDDGSALGAALAKQFKAALNAGGVTEKISDRYKPGQNDYDLLVQKILSTDIDVLYVGGYPAEAGTMIRQLKELASPALLVGGDPLLVDQYWQVAGTTGEGTFATFPSDPQKSAGAQPVVAAFSTETYVPEGYTLHAYAAVQAFAQAATTTRSLDGKSISQWLRAGNSVTTVLGTISFDAKGDVKDPSFAWYKWSEGKFTEQAQFP
jgi:branched-chain amino acid transport system substrate-binding protein